MFQKINSLRNIIIVEQIGVFQRTCQIAFKKMGLHYSIFSKIPHMNWKSMSYWLSFCKVSFHIKYLTDMLEGCPTELTYFFIVSSFPRLCKEKEGMLRTRNFVCYNLKNAHNASHCGHKRLFYCMSTFHTFRICWKKNLIFICLSNVFLAFSWWIKWI